MVTWIRKERSVTKQILRELQEETSAAIQELNALINRMVLLDVKLKNVFDEDERTKKVHPVG